MKNAHGRPPYAGGCVWAFFIIRFVICVLSENRILRRLPGGKVLSVELWNGDAELKIISLFINRILSETELSLIKRFILFEQSRRARYSPIAACVVRFVI